MKPMMITVVGNGLNFSLLARHRANNSHVSVRKQYDNKNKHATNKLSLIIWFLTVWISSIHLLCLLAGKIC
jgi:hypothetical protein